MDEPGPAIGGARSAAERAGSVRLGQSALDDPVRAVTGPMLDSMDEFRCRAIVLGQDRA